MNIRWLGARTRSGHQAASGARRRSRIAASVGAFSLAATALGVTAVSVTPALAAPGTPGTPQASTVLFEEGFQNTASTVPVPLGDYVGVGGQQYTADPAWLTDCNGQIVNYSMSLANLGNCTTVTNAANLRQLAYGLGVHNGAADPAANNAVAAYTEGNPGADAVEFRTVTPVPLASASGRFLTFSVDTSAVNCQVSAPLYQFAFVNEEDEATDVGGIINACNSGTTVTAPAVGGLPDRAVNVGTYTSDGSVLFSGASVGVEMRNANGSGAGNDAAFDNIRILDVTPQLDKSFGSAIAATGATATLTFTVTNTDELAAKNGWSFTDNLSDGLTVATAPTTTCPAGVATGEPGGTSISVTGNLDAGMASCTVTVGVTSATPGTFANGPDNVDVSGLNDPGTSSITFESPALIIAKEAGTPVDVNGNGITDAGDTIQYTFEVTNSGDVAISALAVNDPLVGAVTCPSTTLGAGDSQTCAGDAVYTVTADDVENGSVDNSATASGTSPAGTSVTSDPSTTSTPTEAPDPSMTLVKSADPSEAAAFQPGQEVTYFFTVTNTGNVPLEDIAIDEGEFTGSGELSAIDCPVTTIAPTDQVICEATYTLTQADVDSGSVDNTATAEGTPTGSDTPITSDPSNVSLPIVAAPGISVVKTADPGTIVAAGQTVTYSFVVTNTGNVSLTDVAVDEGEFSGTGELSAVECPAGTLVAGQIVTCTATYTVTQADVDAGTLTNTATADGTPPTGDPVTSTPSTSTVEITQTPGLEVVKTADVEEISEAGQTVTYSFTVRNTGNVTISDATVTEGDFSGAGELSDVTCPADAGTIAPGDSVVCTATYTVVAADLASGELTNTATASGGLPGGGSLSSDPSTATVDAESPAAAPAASGWLPTTGAEIAGSALGLGLVLMALGGTLMVLRGRRDDGEDALI